MPQTPPSPDPMAREVDRLLAQLSSEGPQPVRDPTGNGMTPAVAPALSPLRHTIVSSANPVPSRRSFMALWARIILCVTLAGFMTQWPYPYDCGVGLAGYLGAIMVVMVAGAWVALASWKLRGGVAHIVSLVLLLSGLVLAADQILPRTGYAAEVAHWQCPAVLSTGS